MSLAPIGKPKTIHWVIISKTNPQWNGKGITGGFISILPRDVTKYLKKCEKKYGKQPEDLMYEAHKE